MKKITLVLILTLVFGISIMLPIKISAESVGSMGGNSNNFSNNDDDNWKWWWYGDHGLKISVYKKDGTFIDTKVFLNNENRVKSLNKNGIMVKNGATKRLSLEIEKGSWSKSSSNYFQYLDYTNYVNKSTDLEILDALKSENEETLLTKLGVNQYSNAEKKDIILVIEPASTFYSVQEEKYYFGTYWEFMWMYKNYTGKYSFAWVLESFFKDSASKNVFGGNLMTKKGEISEQSTPEIWAFLGTKFNGFRSKVTTENSLGVAFVTLSKVVDIPAAKDVNCVTDITKGSCNKDYLFKEPKEKSCIVNNDVYKYQAITECGIVYCSQEISTDLDNFYKTFDPIIRSGGYFNMNSIKMDITKTCYLEAFNNNSSCDNWHTMIKEELTGDVKLSLVSDYNLISDSNSATFNAVCDSKSNGKCTKATITQHIEYTLEPTANKYISIKDMAGTIKDIGSDVIDLGSANLTTPITFASGEHQYSLDFTNTPLSKIISRLSTETIDSLDGNYVLHYSYSANLNTSDFKYSCPYTAKNDNPDCVCTEECCDNECNPIPCDNPDEKPGGFPNVIYRPINLEDAFPGEDGTGRDYGSNWKDYVYDEAGNVITKPNGTPYTKEEYYINFNRGYDDYEVYRTEPLYVIKLDYDTMKAIRQYNDDTNHDYNDFTLTCDNGENCISNFLRGNVRGFNINLIDSGTCKTINHSTFNSCISRLGA